jgi:hypothetical protein
VPRVAGHPIPGGHLPLLKIWIEIASSRVTTLAILDSGADYTILPAEIFAGVPGWTWATAGGTLDKGNGAGGEFQTRLVPASVHWDKWVVCNEVRIAEPGKLKIALLGRADFFSNFVVRFLWYRNPPEIDIDPATRR